MIVKLITKLITKPINIMVNWCLVIKRLKVFLFLLFIILLFLIINSFVNLICIDEKVFAAYMIALSALFASTVAMINLRKTDISKERETYTERTAMINNALMKIKVLERKLDFYKEILNGRQPLDNILLDSYGELFYNVMELTTNKVITSYINEVNPELIYSVHDNLFLALRYNRTLSNKIENNPKLNGKLFNSFDSKANIKIEAIINNLGLLTGYIFVIQEKQKEIISKINNEEIF